MSYALDDAWTNCALCRRPRRMYGIRDPRTGWEGWCGLCNWHWHNSKHQERLRRVSKSGPETLEILLREIGPEWTSISFLRPSQEDQRRFATLHFIAARVKWERQLHIAGTPKFRHHFSPGTPIYNVLIGMHMEPWLVAVLEPDEDLNDEGREFLSIFWKLQLAPQGEKTLIPLFKC